MNVLLLIPPGRLFATLNPITTPLGILYCASYLEKNGHSVKFIDALAEKITQNDVLDIIGQDDYCLVGISAVTDNRFSAFDLAASIRKKYPHIKIVLGGPHATLSPEDTLMCHESIDYIIKGEGELTLLELINSLELNREANLVKGLYFRNSKDNKIFFTGQRELVSDLDIFPFPARHLINLEKYNMYSEIKVVGKVKAANILVSRGCPIGCCFCSNTILWGKIIRRRSNENIINEIIHLNEKYKIGSFIFSDDTLNYNKNKLIDLCDQILKLNFKISWSCALRADNFDEKLISLMKNAGCFRINYGVESGSQQLLDNVVEKKIDLNRVLELSKLLNKFGIENWPSFVVSFPGETYHDAVETLTFMKSLQAKPVLNVCRIYPGTKIEKEAIRRRLLPDGFCWAKREDMQKVENAIPELVGDVPFYIEKLTWSQISSILFEWSKIADFNVWKSAIAGLRSIRNFNDIKRLIIMGMAYIKVELKSLMFIL